MLVETGVETGWISGVRSCIYLVDEYNSGMLAQTEYLVREAAELLGLSPDTVRRYSSRGLLRPSRRLGNMLVFSEQEIQRYQVSRRKPGNPHFVKRDAD